MAALWASKEGDMAGIVVMGAGVGGMPAAYDLKKALGKSHEVALVGTSEHFQFTPSNPWVTVGWRKPDQVLVPIRPNVERKGIVFHSRPGNRTEASCWRWRRSRWRSRPSPPGLHGAARARA